MLCRILVWPNGAETREKFWPFGFAVESTDWVVGGLGFEPRQAESESAVLPLDDPPTGAFCPAGQPV